MLCDHERRAGHIRQAQDPTGVGDHAILQILRDHIHAAATRDTAVTSINAVLDTLDWNGRRRAACLEEAMRVVDVVHGEANE